MKPALIWTFISGILTLSIFIPTINQNKSINGYIYYFHSLNCHQNSQSSFVIMGKQVAVCSRCTGIYLGAFLSGLILIFFKIKTKQYPYYLLLCVPMLLDVIALHLKFYEPILLLKSITGLLASVGVTLTILPRLNRTN